MGRTYHFQCTHCGYHADVSGGADSGLNCSVQTIRCHDCRELFDVFTRVRREIGTKEPVRKFPAFAPSEIPPVILRDSEFARKPAAPRQFQWQKLKPACPVSEKHFVELWKQPGRCPRCHAFLSLEGAAFRVWE
jgi:hypothetical protein